MPMVPTPWKLRPSKPPGKTSLTPRGRNAASTSAAIEERQYRDRNRQQSDKTQHDRAELVRRGPQRYRVGGVGPNAFHDMSPSPAAMAERLALVAGWMREVQNPPLSCPAKAGHPVRRGLSVLASLPLEYWITRFRG